MECGDVVFITSCVCRMWDITGSSFGSEGGYPKLSFSPLFHRESILILLQISHGLCSHFTTIILQFYVSENVPRLVTLTRQLCRAESLHPPEHHVTYCAPTDTIKDTRIAHVSDRTCLNKQEQKICMMYFE